MSASGNPVETSSSSLSIDPNSRNNLLGAERDAPIVQEMDENYRRNHFEKGGLSKASTFVKHGADKMKAIAQNEIHKLSHNIGDIRASRFSKWKRNQLVDLLIQNNVELRGEQFIEVSTLREYCEELFHGKPMPLAPTPMTAAELMVAEAAALRIQNRWITNQAIKRYNKILEEEALTQAYLASEGLSAAERSLMEEDSHSPGPDSEEAGDIEMGDFPTIEPEIIPTPPPVNANLTPQESGRLAVAAVAAALAAETKTGEQPTTAAAASAKKPAETATSPKKPAAPRPQLAPAGPRWQKPSFEEAQRYADNHHPRKNKSEKFSVRNTTTGRHCFAGGCGEQCDLWNEGQVSEFAQFGPGVTTYFKYLKWNFWVFTMLSFLSIIPVVFNYYGPSQQAEGLSDLAKTTAGNLEAITSNSTDIQIPGCSGYNYNGVDCSITPDQLAETYCYLDLIGVIIVMLAYVWLRIFETKEEVILNQNTVTAADFTVRVDNLPKGVTEAEIKSHFVKVCRHAVAQVVIAYNNSMEIAAFRKRGQLVQERYRIIQEKAFYEYLREHNKRPIYNEKKVFEQLDQKKKEIGAQIKHLESTLFSGEEDSTPLCAFVTFEEKIGVISAKATYSTSLLGWLCMSDDLKLKGNRLKISDATEPSTIIWENLNFSYWERLQRRSRTMVIAAALIFVSLVAQFISVLLQRSATDSAGTGTCPDGWEDWSAADQEVYVENHPDTLHCYCNSLQALNTSNSLCSEYFKKQVQAQVITYFASFTVLAINTILETAVRLFAEYEKHHSVDLRGRSIFQRLFWLYVVNTGVVFLIQVNPSRLQFVRQLSGLDVKSEIENFSAEWYFSVGVTVILVQMGMVFSNHLHQIYHYYMIHRRIANVKRDPLLALTQDDLNAIHLGPEFKLPSRYAQQISTFFVCMVFSTGMPLLNFIAMANFFVTYAMDKFMFIHMYRSPPRYNVAVCRSATRIIPWALVCHLIFSIWTLSTTTIFRSDAASNTITDNADPSGSYFLSSFITRLWDASTAKDTLPLFCLLVVLIVLLLVEYFIRTFYGSVGQLFVAIFGNVCSNIRYFNEIKNYYENQNSRHLTYSRAVQRGIIKGLATYNILQNPHYMEGFAISAQFASQHHNLRSMRFMNNGAETKAQKSKRLARAEKIRKANAPPRELTRLNSTQAREMLILREMDASSFNLGRSDAADSRRAMNAV